ncbi:uncharacterized protein LOC131802590 [Musca domestica]|uniref:Uncharacterized protein LOC131802590 n=1 Tax=Musca domestica TaxID=7370 RepID=A0A1I8N8Z5_MUSDO|nr:uncharacterized protein LOC131802590 [Musca domestica]XP_058978909.1 uncharacterized protein LOC131802590 [Musca domestica]XP_058978910.1 uncharacterized protein LOC131802590 [Musca domestica]XP_058978911.1 uncharacterized protein LOC131802590 [Musca domestica]
MKYPQLVSPRAVNAISDWLVSRLEQLGVESPQIYTRLLLSLLQSSVQVNDPIEFSNLEAFFANRKGGHSKRFHLPSDTETLKKLNAVQCLREIVSNEQETAAIERLVDELCEKLKDIEKRSQELNDEERFLIDTQLKIDSLSSSATTATGVNNNHHHQQQQQQHHHNLYHNQSLSSSSASSSATSSSSASAQQHLISSASHCDSHHSRRSGPHANENALNDNENDPKKRYFRAFPALSKEMEDSFRIWRRNAKSLTWPIVGRSSLIVTENQNRTAADNSNNSTTASSESSIADSKSVEKKSKSGGGVDQLKAEFTGDSAIGRSGSSLCGDVQQQQQQQQGAIVTSLGAAASAKKKSKRRRNQALSKGKQIPNIRKPITTATGNSNSNTGKSTHHRNTSPAWDTDFKGCWEMGPDLIKEFLARQKGTAAATKRSRSNSDSMDADARNEYKMISEIPKRDELLSGIERPLMKRYVDISFCCDDSDDRQHYEVVTDDGVDYVDEDYDDDNTLASIEELSSASGNNVINARRLYQREGTLQRPFLVCNTGEDRYLDDSSESVDHLDFANFKAKFNSSVEALWKDVEPAAAPPQQQTVFEGAVKTGTDVTPIGISSAFYATTSLNALAPFKQDLWNFWSNYNNQPPQTAYDQVAKFPNNTHSNTTSSMITTTKTQRLDDSSASSGAGADIANSSDYYSMPSNLDDFDKSVGAMRRINEAGASLGVGGVGGGGAHTPSINLFLQNSIWSSSGDCVDAVGAASETDESFLYKVWHSNKKLSQIDMAAKNKNEKIAESVGDLDCASVIYHKGNDSQLEGGNGAKLDFTPYNNLKWSEGINAGPAYNSLRSNVVTTGTSGDVMDSCGEASKYAAAYNSAAIITSTGANWEAPIYGQNTQPDLKSWCASNPVSLTEMYGSDVCDSITQDVPESAIDVASGPEVTLPNHCAATSGFIAYARIKASGSVIQPQTKPLQSQQVAHNMASDYFRGGEEENLLTSERTHFHPIETYVDGYTFDISSALDCVEFERSASGYLCYDSNEYLEYTRNDIYLADEEVSNTNLMNFSATASSQVADGKVHAAKEKPENREMFVLKFKLKRTGEIACQTEEIDFQLATAKMSNQHQMAGIDSMEMSMFSLDNSLSLSRQANNEAIMAAVTQAVAAAAKAAAEHQGLNTTAHHQSSGRLAQAWVPAATRSECTQSWVQEASLSDEVDFCRATAPSAEQLSQFWSMQEVEKQCHKRRLPPRANFARVDMDRNEDSSLDKSSHTLWGMCAVCNSCDYGKSLPANRLLRDELKLEADEIMSDLRYMQDLYIGESDSVAENINDGDDANVDGGRREADKHQTSPGDGMKQQDYNVANLQNPNDSAVQAIMLLKVNQLIEDLLKPDQTGKLIRAKFEEQTFAANVPTANNDWPMTVDDDAVDNSNSWHFGGGGGVGTHQQTQALHNIWQHDASENVEKENSKFVAIKPMKLLRQVGGSLNEEDLYVDKLNWEHDHLAKIWQRDEVVTTSLAGNDEIKTSAVEGNKIEHEVKEEENIQLSQGLVEKNNLKNLQNINNTTPPSSAASSALATNNSAAYKRVQQFLNSSAAKLKLAANRKRRHSASQNFYKNHSLHTNNNNHNSNSNNNNNDAITDLNRYKFEEKMIAANEMPLTGQTNQNEATPKQTIITCKYWTTSTNGTQASMDSAAAAMMLLAAAANKTTIIDGSDGVDIMTTANSQYDEDTNDEGIMLEDNTFGNTFSCLIDKNASILKHVTMMTRPLTR